MEVPKIFEARRTETGSFAIYDTRTNQRFSVAFYWSPDQADEAAGDLNKAYALGQTENKKNVSNE